jgi:hypothetical protein
VIFREARRFFAEFNAAIAPLPEFEDRVVEGFVVSLRFATDSALLGRLLCLEPETLLPFLTVGGGRILASARAFSPANSAKRAARSSTASCSPPPNLWPATWTPASRPGTKPSISPRRFAVPGPPPASPTSPRQRTPNAASQTPLNSAAASRPWRRRTAAGVDPRGAELIKYTNNAVYRLPAAGVVVRLGAGGSPPNAPSGSPASRAGWRATTPRSYASWAASTSPCGWTGTSPRSGSNSPPDGEEWSGADLAGPLRALHRLRPPAAPGRLEPLRRRPSPTRCR